MKKHPLLGAAVAAGTLVALPFYGISKYYFNCAFVRKSKLPKKFRNKNEDPRFRLQMEEYEQKTEEGTAWFKSKNHEEIWVNSLDGLKLHGYFLAAPGAKRVIVCAHGYRSEALREFSKFAGFYYKNHCSMLIIDQRGHGLSDGDYITFGATEQYDIDVWCDYLANVMGLDLPIYLHGISMGATTVTLAANHTLSGNVKGIIADCGFTSPKAMVEYVASQIFKVATKPFCRMVDHFCRAKADFSLYRDDTVETLKHANYPLLFIHGEKDTYVPTAMSYQNYAVCSSEKRILTVEGACHATSYIVNPVAYQEALLDFFREND